MLTKLQLWDTQVGMAKFSRSKNLIWQIGDDWLVPTPGYPTVEA